MSVYIGIIKKLNFMKKQKTYQINTKLLMSIGEIRATDCEYIQSVKFIYVLPSWGELLQKKNDSQKIKDDRR